MQIASQSRTHWTFNRKVFVFALFQFVLCTWPAKSSAQIVFGQNDDFQGGTVAGWSQGANSPNPPTNVANGGPTGAGDRYLQVRSSGGFGAGSKMIAFNASQWTGNYVAAGVTRISIQMANFGATPLHMRIALQGGPGLSIYGSTLDHEIPADGVWRPYAFDLTPTAMTNIAGADTLAQTLGNVITLRILSAQAGPTFNGDTLVGTLGIDTVVATAVPSPPRVAQTRINASASNQRSRVTSLEVTFSTQVTFAGAVGDAFSLSRNGGGGVTFTATANVVTGATVVTLNAFAGAEVEFDSLRDGRYTLTALQNQISAGGLALDGNGDGTAGDDYTFGDTQGLYRMYGDVSGLDRRVDISDFGFFSLAYLTPANYNAALDFNGDGRIDIADFGQFSVRYFTSLP